ncbi:uncharacterized protein MONOS_9611 [Monocercomonoides exilis]|uniref:uncharacterized protein n=1 Tax=Monocercomonoides exilis TaxID=2049356 RepID=UPI00355AAAF6|nr:hypothetical protein MONOS_9611 [Monocercomonoides exilis]|eukprot:MONOS_9611.1-p1 / transcript=MONOS_9611.1 / gene=MONOS_9611 / organism=Monocercomonoides_exilis_PA203 / gene_product=unspecified product / transcript_product=unspecified product / location=Mono_scaffold00402:42312-43055(-) / protein_length=248 / sequence_SO=supercontig / SO=protein_coding / is_pseudo=false
METENSSSSSSTASKVSKASTALTDRSQQQRPQLSRTIVSHILKILFAFLVTAGTQKAEVKTKKKEKEKEKSASSSSSTSSASALISKLSLFQSTLHLMLSLVPMSVTISTDRKGENKGTTSAAAATTTTSSSSSSFFQMDSLLFLRLMQLFVCYAGSAFVETPLLSSPATFSSTLQTPKLSNNKPSTSSSSYSSSSSSFAFSDLCTVAIQPLNISSLSLNAELRVPPRELRVPRLLFLLTADSERK